VCIGGGGGGAWWVGLRVGGMLSCKDGCKSRCVHAPITTSFCFCTYKHNVQYTTFSLVEKAPPSVRTCLEHMAQYLSLKNVHQTAAIQSLIIAASFSVEFFVNVVHISMLLLLMYTFV
jgi:hypothetical protein